MRHSNLIHVLCLTRCLARFWAWCLALCLALQAGLWSAPCLAQSPDVAQMRQLNPAMPLPLKIDPERVAAAGIEVLKGQHIDLYTDLRDRSVTEELVQVFDAAIPRWCEYFEVDPKRTASYRLSAMIIADRNQTGAFRKAGLMPDDLPDFLAGYNRGHEMWVFLQPGDYYTRHLLLHEGTHAFMQWFLGGSGPAWYSEGMAELLGLNRWQDGKLTLGYRVRSNLECPYWGRVKIIREDVAKGKSRSLDEVMNISSISFRQVDAYAWAWAACNFLSHHDLTWKPFARLGAQARNQGPSFNQEFRQVIEKDRQAIERDWKLYLDEMVYGYDVMRAGLTRCLLAEYANADNPDGNQVVAVNSGFSWQQTPWQVEQGEVFELAASGQFEVSQGEKLLPCEAGGITIEYYRGRPLGELTLAILTTEGEGPARLVAKPLPIGLGGQFRAPASGVICLRFNVSPARLDENRGALKVRIKTN